MGIPDLKTIDSLIREKARNELKSRITRAFAPARDMVMTIHAEYLPRFTDQGGRRTTAKAALDEIENTLFHHMVKDAEEEAIREYVGRMDKLQRELDSLRAQLMEGKDAEASGGSNRGQNPNAERGAQQSRARERI